jgi:hypothetical protein
MRTHFIALLAAASLAAPAFAAETAVEDKVVCKRDRDTDLGSNIRKSNKTCMKKSEWRQLERDAAEAIRGVDARSGRTNGEYGTGPGRENLGRNN